MLELTAANFEEVLRINEMIGKYVGAIPEVEYSVGSPDGKSFCFSPKSISPFFSPEDQKRECERFLCDQKAKDFIFKDYIVIKQEHYPSYHQDADALFKVMDYIENNGLGNLTYRCTIFREKPLRIVHIASPVPSGAESEAANMDRHTAFFIAIKGFIEAVRSFEEIEKPEHYG